MGENAVVFAYPKMMFTERFLTAGIAHSVYFDQDELRTDRDMMVDYIWVSSYLNGNVTAQTLLRGLNINWAIEGGPWWFAQDVVPCLYLQKLWDSDRTTNASVATNLANPVFAWKHKPLWQYPAKHGISFQWGLLGSGAPPGIPNLGVGFHGIGIHSGRRRIFQSDWILDASVAWTQELFGGTTPTTLHNLEDEPYLVDRTNVAVRGTNTMLAQFLNVYKLQVIPSWGDPWSEMPVPLLMYGPHLSQNNRDLWYQPDGGPFLLKAGKSLKFRFQQTQHGNCDLQIGIIGRVAYGSSNG